MLLTRRFEERVSALYREGRISGGCYLGMGNEATSVGTAWLMREQDILVPSHRDLGSHLVRGHSVLDVMRQYLSRGTAQTRGRDAGLHLGRPGSQIVGMISHLGHMAAVAAGAAMAERLLGRDAVVLTTLGDGATSLGDVHEALNFAAVQRLPVVFVIVNNQYAYSTPVNLQYACERLADRGAGYGIPGVQVDGTDVFQVLDAAGTAFARARSGEGPTLLECVTMRMRGHAEHDDSKYVPPELLARWRKWDPLERLASWARAEGHLDAQTEAALEERTADTIEQALRTAESEPSPSPASAVEGVFRAWEPGWSVPPRENGMPQ